ncbi:uncharacterized protein [Branchiostoma lanceolatum]|uniref:uncharacterized protein isoform X1 n=1 Tax=Branchiostoma lanceolatum TaxID=7740 RepID=UPI003456C89C
MGAVRTTYLLLIHVLVYQHIASAAVLAPRTAAGTAGDSPTLLDRVVDSILTDNDAELNNAINDVRSEQRNPVALKPSGNDVTEEKEKNIFSSQLKTILESVDALSRNVNIHQSKETLAGDPEREEEEKEASLLMKSWSPRSPQNVGAENNEVFDVEKGPSVNGARSEGEDLPGASETTNLQENRKDLHKPTENAISNLQSQEVPKREQKTSDDSALPMDGQGSVSDTVQVKKSAPAFMASAAGQIGEKVVNKLGDRIADGVVENHQGKVVNSLQDYFGKQLDNFDKQYKDVLGQTNNLAAGLSRPVEEADVRVLPISRGDDMGNTFVPAGYEISHKYHYVDEKDDEQDSSTATVSAYSYPVGLGPVVMNGCFGTGYVNGDPCWEAKIPRESCPNLIDGATFLGVGFDGRGEYSADSRKRSIVQRSCNGLQTYEDHEVPDTMTVQGVYDTDVESNTFASMEGYREYLEQKSAVTSAKAMFQQELNKAAGYGAGGGIFGLGYSAGGGFSNQNARSDQSSNFRAGSQAAGRLSDKNTQTYMALLEINVFRYEIFMDDVEPADLNLAFLRDFLKLPVSYFSIGADQDFQNFIIRYGTHYTKSAKFGGQVKIIKTKEASKELTIQAFSERAQTEWKKAFSTFSAEASQTKSSSWWHEHETRKESQKAEGEASAGSAAAAEQSQTENLHSFEFSNEMIVVQGGNQRIAAAITEMYTTSLSTELKTWLESIKDYPKAFSFIMKPITAVLDINFDSIFPNGAVDFGCLGKSDLKVENATGRRYYVQETKKTVGNITQDISEVRYCDFKRREELAEKLTKRRLALGRAIAVYLEEGPLLSTDFLLPAGEPGCESATLAYLDDSHSGSPTWAELVSGTESTVIFDMPYDISSILRAQEILTLKFHDNSWFSVRTGGIPHLYDGYKNGGSNDVNGHKVSVQGLVMTYSEETGVLTVTEDDFEASKQVVPELPDWVKGQAVARAEYKSLLKHLSNQQRATNGDAPCNIKWSNAHRIDPADGGKCIHFTAASEGDIFVVFAGIPRNYETWLYIQISPEGVALYKAMRLETTQLKEGASSLGSSNLYQSYFVCVTEDTVNKATTVQYGKTPDNEERPHIWLDFQFNSILSLHYYAFASGMYPVKVMGVSLLDQQAQDFIICREGTEKDEGRCRQRCHPECDGCRTTGSDSPTDCIACRHFSVAYPYIDGEPGSSICVSACPEHMELLTDTSRCTCKKQMEASSEGGRVTCVTDCPLTHYLDGSVCKKCHSFCQDVSKHGTNVCTGPNSNQCNTCKYAVNGACSEGCSPGQKAVNQSDGSFRCDQCQSGYKCERGDEVEEVCPAGTYSNQDRTGCGQCPAGQYSSSGSSSCTQCPAGQFNPRSGASSCQTCSVGMTSNAGATSCYEINECASNPCHNGAHCENRMNSYYCQCTAGYKGTNCETDINDCSPNPCRHDGVCTDRVNGFSCACKAGYAGDTCETDLDYEIRLVGGNYAHEGRVEIQYRDGPWGTVCDDSWDANDAAVACRQLGYRYGVHVALTGQFGPGSGGRETIFLDEVGCSGSESNLDHCSHDPHGTHDCGHNEDVGIICSICRSGWKQHGDHCYQITGDEYTKTWSTAKIICDDGGILAMPKDQATNDFLVNMIRETSTETGTWIGLDDLQSVGTYVWDDGTPLSYTNWAPGEPSTGHERCVMYFSGATRDDQKYKWNDSSCDTKAMFICQQNRHY